MCHRYSFFDDFDEILGWGYLGLAKAINKFEEDPDIPFVRIAFSMVKQEIFNAYKRRKVKGNDRSIDEDVFTDEAGKETALKEFLVSEDQIDYSESDIITLFDEALFEESVNKKNITIDYYLNDKSLNEIANHYGISAVNVTKSHRRGKELIKRYLVNNGVILEHVSKPSSGVIKKENITNHKTLNDEDLAKIKYIRHRHKNLRINDIAKLLNTSSYMISQLIYYPTTTYLRIPQDESIKNLVEQYSKESYPEREPSEVKVYSIGVELMV